MRVYADHAATTPLDSRVFDAMIPFFKEKFHNPSSLYPGGRLVRQAIEESRDQIAAYIGSTHDELFFTSGGTESANIAIKGAARSFGKQGRIVIGITEHHAVGLAAKALADEGYSVCLVPCDREGYISPDVLDQHMTDDTKLVSIMWANNETGLIQPIAELCAVAHKHGALFHTDAVQAIGSQKVRLDEIPVDLLSFSSHKIYGPMGCGALFIRDGTTVTPIIHGGSQEKLIRAGTENPAAIIGFAKAVELLSKEREERLKTQYSVAQRLLEKIACLPDVLCNSPQNAVVPGIISLSIAGVLSEPLLILLGVAGIDASMGAACNTDTVEPSYVLKAMGVPDDFIQGNVRFSFGKDSIIDEAELAAEALIATVKKLRRLS